METVHVSTEQVKPLDQHISVLMKFLEGDEMLIELRPASSTPLNKPPLRRLVVIPEASLMSPDADFGLLELNYYLACTIEAFYAVWMAQRRKTAA